MEDTSNILEQMPKWMRKHAVSKEQHEKYLRSANLCVDYSEEDFCTMMGAYFDKLKESNQFPKEV